MLLLAVLANPSPGFEENDLNLLIFSYEEESINIEGLASFLDIHGFEAKPTNNYVTVKLSNGKEIFLVPNGAQPGLADLWMIPPSSLASQSSASHSEPKLTIKSDAVQKNAAYAKSDNQEFIDTLKKSANFPVAPLGMCLDGAQKLAKIYRGLGYNIYYLYYPSSGTYQGHIWVAAEDPAHKDTWMAVDSYYGPMTDDERYYKAPYSFSDIKYLDLIKPRYRLS